MAEVMGEGQQGLRDDKQNQSSQSETPEHDRVTKLEREVATERYPKRDRLGESDREVWGWGWWGHTHTPVGLRDYRQAWAEYVGSNMNFHSPPAMITSRPPTLAQGPSSCPPIPIECTGTKSTKCPRKWLLGAHRGVAT